LRIERRLHWWSATLDCAVWLSRGESTHAHGEPTRRCEALDGTVFQSSVVKPLLDPLGERRR
jgi:hypothetical protein